MQGTTEEKTIEGSMIITLKKNLNTLSRVIINSLLLSFLSFCKPDLVDNPIPFVPFDDIVINLTLPAYSALSSDGGFVYVNSGGVKGIILYRQSISNYLAFERNCSFQPNDACATVDAELTRMKDSCCGSTFEYTGQPSGGPAWRPLQQYQTILSGSTLTITDVLVD